MEELSPFGCRHWGRAIAGYEWVDAEVTDPLVSEPYRAEILFGKNGDRLWPADEAPSEFYRPMDCPELHRTFSETRGTKEAILGFCVTWGHLGAQTVRFRNPWNAPDTEAEGFEKLEFECETFAFWQYQTTKVRSLLELHEALSDQHVKSRVLDVALRCPRLDEVEPIDARTIQRIQVGDAEFSWSTFCPYNLRFEYANLTTGGHRNRRQLRASIHCKRLLPMS